MHRYCSFYRKEIFRKVAGMLVYLISVSLFSGNVSVKNEVQKKKRMRYRKNSVQRWGAPVYLFSNKLDGFKSHKCVLSQFWRLGIQNQVVPQPFWFLQLLTAAGPPWLVAVDLHTLPPSPITFSSSVYVLSLFWKKKIIYLPVLGLSCDTWNLFF